MNYFAKITNFTRNSLKTGQGILLLEISECFEILTKLIAPKHDSSWNEVFCNKFGRQKYPKRRGRLLSSAGASRSSVTPLYQGCKKQPNTQWESSLCLPVQTQRRVDPSMKSTSLCWRNPFKNRGYLLIADLEFSKLSFFWVSDCRGRGPICPRDGSCLSRTLSLPKKVYEKIHCFFPCPISITLRIFEASFVASKFTFARLWPWRLRNQNP